MTTELIVRALIIGVGATAIMDLWALLLNRVFKIPSLNYAMVGRWVGYLKKGAFTHQSIASAAPIKGEAMIGWIAHYAIGVLFGGALLLVWGIDWASEPTLTPALIVGIATISAPFFILQPGMGAGIAASKMPQPNVARLRSFNAHLSFGIGLYIAALAAELLF